MKKILVGLDGSPHEAAVLAAAREQAERMGGQLLLFRAVPLPVEIPANALGVTPTSLGDMLIDIARTHLDEVARGLPPGMVAGQKVELGSPWRTLCEAAKAAGVDLIVIGSHGYGGLDRLLGTTAAKIVNHAETSVLVVRPA
jgi:nucleotide-binding universal stress UspA family protein